MKSSEIFTKLSELRTKIERDTEEPMQGSDNALLYDVAKVLGLSEEQAAMLAGDTDTSQSEGVHDFDTGLGIGGLSRHRENLVIPTVAQMERVEERIKRATTCRRCGQDDEFDGAMFTTGGGNVCDDCF